MHIALNYIVQDEMQADFRASPFPFFALEADEVTDAGNISILIIYIRNLSSLGEVTSRFLAERELTNTAADSIYNTMRSVMADRGLFDVDLVELATAVMVGIKTDVATKFKEKCPWIIISHCLAHRLQLAAEKAANQVPYHVKYISVLNQFTKSLKYSPKLCRVLEESKALHGEKSNKIKQVFFTRWLSFNDSVQALVNCITSVISCLQVVAMERGTPGRALLHGLVQQMSCYSFIIMTHFLADAVGILGLLSRSLQRADLPYDQSKAIIDVSILSI
ncbi:zinc finger protein 862-like [Tachypleus tridentatus]|uniref:zinc finger protein 862-like n=1 Tax=Tachypleus tridentatus TaxID=6853 RepID=UPI003FCFFF8B